MRITYRHWTLGYLVGGFYLKFKKHPAVTCILFEDKRAMDAVTDEFRVYHYIFILYLPHKNRLRGPNPSCNSHTKQQIVAKIDMHATLTSTNATTKSCLLLLSIVGALD